MRTDESRRTAVARFLAATALAIWIGGFAFYGAAVLPALHQTFGVAASAVVTRRVTNILNAIGLVAVVLAWLVARLERDGPRPRLRFSLVATTTATLVLLFLLHRVMDDQIDSDRRGRFYPLHRVYLLASTLQWFANLGLLALSTARRG
jgi:hypothetical protein